ncbi:MAG: type I restriction-modification system subunit M [Candidatus Pacebacteria bacterium]|nr:type I restriction-modification system subunit M [Candidatus Paceibacterota bacterium]
MAKESLKKLEERLWDAANSLRANSGLTVHQYSQPVLGLIFLRFAEFKFEHADNELKNTKKTGASLVRERKIGPEEYQAKGIMYIPEIARFSYLLNLKEGVNIGKAINDAMKEIEEYNPNLKSVLPKTYNKLENHILIGLLKTFSEIPMDVEGDVFGKIYEYFLSSFAMAEGQGGGEFFTPTSLVKLIVEILEPYQGKVYDPACGSGGMFVQSAEFVKKHKNSTQNIISIYGQEKSEISADLCKMNLAVHGLEGQIKQGNTFYEDLHESVGQFDFVMANPPFNVSGVDKEKVREDKRYRLGIPTVDNANYLWIEHFYESLNKNGRAGFVMANSASDARGTELEIRKKLIESGVVDVMVAIGGNFFYTVTLSCTLWFFDKGKINSNRKDKILFIDARNIYRQIDRAHREFTPEQIDQIANIVRAYRGESGAGKYEDVKGLCKVATLQEVAEAGYSLNPGRYVGTEVIEESEEDFQEKVKNLSNDLENLFKESAVLEKKIKENLKKIL